MDEHDYVYQLKPLIVPGIVFLLLYPLLLGFVHIISKLPALELKILIGIYVIAGIGILVLWLIGKGKHVQIKEDRIIFKSLLGEHTLKPKDIRRVAVYFDGKGQEVAQIRTNDEIYYLSEFYFPFPELMSDLENFVRQYNLHSNVKSYADLNG